MTTNNPGQCGTLVVLYLLLAISPGIHAILRLTSSHANDEARIARIRAAGEARRGGPPVVLETPAPAVGGMGGGRRGGMGGRTIGGRGGGSLSGPSRATSGTPVSQTPVEVVVPSSDEEETVFVGPPAGHQSSGGAAREEDVVAPRRSSNDMDVSSSVFGRMRSSTYGMGALGASAQNPVQQLSDSSDGDL